MGELQLRLVAKIPFHKRKPNLYCSYKDNVCEPVVALTHGMLRLCKTRRSKICVTHQFTCILIKITFFPYYANTITQMYVVHNFMTLVTETG
uniref:Uncharacterized protein n=1 Tax=Anguilla anguilla TaxID=7936 RepID=A0A0E9WQD8_ANGAN